MKLTAIDIIAAWLKTRMGQVIGSYELETVVPKHAMLYHKFPITPGTVNRKFRNLRSDPSLQAYYGLHIILEPQSGKESKWRVKPYSTNSPSVPLATEQSSFPSVNSVAA